MERIYTMIEYNVYWKSNSVITGENITWIQGIFLNEDNAKLFLKALQKAHPESSYFISEWDTEKNTFIK